MVYIGIGSNLGNRITNIEKAKYLLSLNGINIISSSSYYETLSWPNPNKPKFINVVIQTNTKFSPECCPSSYTTGQGCACISDRVKKHIGSRGGNN